ncbi:MAG TPA: DUF4215 domain-containing protein [Nitrosopumilaceae archaeon]|nr:DUF4215 domain-containing protein [Nitrosopumilaceae archaeon]
MNRGILTIFSVAVFFAILFGSAVLSPQAFAGVDPPTPNNAGKVTICHNGDDGPETITVSANAVDKHLNKHGDHVGACFVCGDGFTDPPTETCDDAVDNGKPGFCNATCDGIVPTAACGDGTTTPPETCDDGNTSDGDGCSASCNSDETCGNGFTDTGLGETCDDGNTSDGDGCSASCVVEFCGDGIANNGEECDGSDLNEMKCSDHMFDFGTLACDSSCNFDTSGCEIE